MTVRVCVFFLLVLVHIHNTVAPFTVKRREANGNRNAPKMDSNGPNTLEFFFVLPKHHHRFPLFSA